MLYFYKSTEIKKAQITQDIKWCYMDEKFETQPSKTHVTCSTIYNFDLSYLKPLDKGKIYHSRGFLNIFKFYFVDQTYFMMRF